MQGLETIAGFLIGIFMGCPVGFLIGALLTNAKHRNERD